jgi:DNA (cytosine-5)-methyltransferase 1
MNQTIKAADLFCGAGGTSAGLVEAAHDEGFSMDLTAVNHWPTAVETHALNHPHAKHLCAALDSINPRSIFKEGELDILWASPECTHHSVARGGKPINDQSRATAWCVVRWAEALRPKVILVENVKEFETWGQIGHDGRPLASKKGGVFHAWVEALKAVGYRVEWRILCAADYGDPTTRRRLFVYAVRGRRKIVWPEPTHSARGSTDFFSVRRPWRTAREIIDWQHQGKSIYARKKPLAEKTMRRILIGLEKYGLAPFIVPQHQGGRPVHSTVEPVSAVTTTGAHALAQPYLIHLRGTGTASTIEDPAPAVTAGGQHIGLAQPFLVQTCHGNGSDENGDARRSRGLEAPLPTVAGNRGDWALCQPYVVAIDHNGSETTAPVTPADAPISTVTSKQRHAICQPFIIPQNSEPPTRSIDEPAPTVTTTSRGVGLVQPYLVKFYGNSDAASVEQPLDSATTRARFGLCQPRVEINGEQYLVDILFRMLTPKELARAQGFPDGYKFTGSTTDVVKQIGNAVPKNLAKALGQSAIRCL